MLKNMLVLCVGNAKLESAVLIHIPFMKAVLENQTQTQINKVLMKFWRENYFPPSVDDALCTKLPPINHNIFVAAQF